MRLFPNSRARRIGATAVAVSLLGSFAAPAHADVQGWWWGELTGTGSLTVDLARPADQGDAYQLVASTWQGDGFAARTAAVFGSSTSVTWQQGWPTSAPGLPAGPYVVEANINTPTSIYPPGFITESGWVPQTGRGEVPAIVLADGQTKILAADIPIGGTVTATLVDSRGTRLNAQVEMTGVDGSASRTTFQNDNGGPFVVTGLNSEQYVLRVDVNGANYFLAPDGDRLAMHLTDDPGAVPAWASSRAAVVAEARDLGTLVVDDPFTDVRHTDKFAFEIVHMLTHGITTGFPDGSFRPLSTVNRDAMAAYLYRLAGSPAYTAPPRSPFVDVPRTNQFYKEISWLASTQISQGWEEEGVRQFRPYEPVARDAMAAFLYRFVERFGEIGDHPRLFPTPTVSPFRDVSTSQQFFREMAWLRGTEISTGWEDGTYRPLSYVNRDAMSAFIYRAQGSFLGD